MKTALILLTLLLLGTAVSAQPVWYFAEGTTLTASIRADSPTSMTYRWARDGVNILDADPLYGPPTGGDLNFVASSGTIGIYTCRVTNQAGSAVSEPARLAILSPPTIIQQPIFVPAGAPVVIGYNIYRGAAEEGLYVRLNGAPIQGTAWSDRAPLPGVNFYVATAVNDRGGESVFSNKTVVRAPGAMAEPEEPLIQIADRERMLRHVAGRAD